MQTNWLALGVALCAFGAGGADTGPAARLVAAAVVGVVLLADRRRAVVLAAVLLGGLGALRVGSPPRDLPDPSETVPVALELVGPVVDGRAAAWMRSTGRPPLRVRVRGLGDQALARGAKLLGTGRLQDLRRRATPDQRARWRAARTTGARAGVVVEEIVGVVDRGRASGPERWRRRWSRSLDLRLGSGAGLWRALVLGDRSSLDRRARRRVQQLGLAHLLALSGMHTSIVAAALLWPLRKRGRRALVWALPALGAWVILAGGAASITRAVGMAAWWVGARRAGRPCRPEDALAAVALAEVALRPQLVCGVGWWLSYAATLGVLRAIRASARWPAPLRAVGISVGAQLATLAWVLDAFGFVSVPAPAVLLVAGPAFAAMLVSGLGLLALGGMVGPLARFTDPLVLLLSHGFGGLLRLLAPAGELVLRYPGFGELQWAGVLGAVAALLWPAGPGIRARAAVAVAGLLLCLLPGSSDHEWVVFDVGQGDAMALRCGREFLVVDTGPRYAERSPAAWTVADWLTRRRARRVRLLLTHSHLDHRGGLATLLATGRVDTLFVAACDTSRAWVGRVREAASTRSVVVRALQSGDRLVLGHCHLDVLWPAASAAASEANDRSLVLAWPTPAGPILLTGDLERETEAELVADGRLPRDLAYLKVAHHGGDTGTDAATIDVLHPARAVVSAGAGNRYGHPAAAVLERLRAASVDVLRTDRCGFVRVRWKGIDGRLSLDCGLDP